MTLKARKGQRGEDKEKEQKEKKRFHGIKKNVSHIFLLPLLSKQK
jgi:hypothetical protein